MPMELPTLDPNDPQFEEKKQIHDYVRQVETAHQGYVKNQPDYTEQYQRLADYVDTKPEPKRFSALSAFAIGMGNPEALKNVSAANLKAEEAHTKRDQYLLDLRETAMKGNIQKLMEEGNFKKVLTESTALMELHRAQKAAAEKRQQIDEISKIKERNKGTLSVANVRADAARASAIRRASTLANGWGLTPTESLSIDTMYKAEIEHAVTTDPETGDKVVNDETLLKIRSAWQDDLEALGEKLHPENSPDYKRPAETPATSAPADTAAATPRARPTTQPAAKNAPPVKRPDESAMHFQLRLQNPTKYK
jgi:hypothetical protein